MELAAVLRVHELFMGGYNHCSAGAQYINGSYGTPMTSFIRQVYHPVLERFRLLSAFHCGAAILVESCSHWPEGVVALQVGAAQGIHDFDLRLLVGLYRAQTASQYFLLPCMRFECRIRSSCVSASPKCRALTAVGVCVLMYASNGKSD